MKKLISLVLIALICVGLLVACGPSEQDRLNAAKDYLDIQMKNKGEVTNGDFVVYDVISMNENGTSVQYSVTWTVTKRDGTAISADDVKVDVNAETGETKIIVNKMAEADIEYTLTATIKNANGASVTTSYNRKIPKFVENTHAEYLAAADGHALIVKGVITSIVNTTSNREFYLQDADGGYYVYGLTAEVISELQIGQEVRVRGSKKLYNGIAEIVNPTVEVLNATPVTVNPVDITSAIANISDLSSDAALKYQGMYVKINGAFILGQVSSNNTYYDVLVNGKDGKLLQTYLRISSSANPLNETDTDAFKNTFKDNVGKDADISGVVSIYGGKIYLIPCRTNALENFQTVDRNDAGKLAIEQIIMDKVYDITEAGKVTLQDKGKTYNDVTFTWALTANDYVTLNGNVLNTPVLPDEATTITLALTIKAGDATETKTYTVKVNAAPTVVADTDITVAPGTVYVFFVNQKNIPQKLYWDGTLKQNTSFLQTTTNPEKAAKVVAQLVEGTTDKYILYRDVNGAKQYINVLDNESGTSPSVVLDRYETNVKNYFSYNAELGIFTVDATILPKNATETKVDTFYFGCYGTYDTFSLSSTYYITGSNAANLDVTQHPARFATLIDTEELEAADMIAREKADLDIKVDFATSGTINLPVNGGLFGKVVITWSAATNNGAVVIENGVLTATPQDAETTVVVTATLALGEATVTKPFNVVVAAKPAAPAEPIFQNGDKVVIANPAFNKLLSMTKTGYYNVGVDYTAGDYSAAGNDEIFVVTVNVDGTYTFTSLSGKVLAMADSNSSLNDTGANNKWVLEEVDGQDDLYLVKNTVRGNYLEWYNSKNNWSTYTDPSDNQFYIAFFAYDDSQTGGGEDDGGDDVTPPAGDNTPTGATMPYTAGVAYKLYINHVQLGGKYYFNGATAGQSYRLALTNYVYDAVDVFIEEVKESDVVVGFRFYFMNDTTKTYIDAFLSGSYLNISLTATPSAVFTYNETYGTFVTMLGTNETALGAYGDKNYIQASNTSYFSGSNASALGVTQYVIKFEAANDIPAETDEARVANAKENLDIQTAFNADGTINLPTVADNGATIAWTKDGVAYTEATLAIVQTDAEQTIILVATIASNGVSDTKEFTITVAAKVAEGSVKTYTMQAVVDGTTYYWTGAASGGKGTLTINASLAATVYAEKVDDGYNVYILDNGSKKYLNLTKDSNTGFYTGEASLVQIDAENRISYTDANGNTRYVATYGVQDIRTYKTSNIPGSSKNAYCTLVEVAA